MTTSTHHADGTAWALLAEVKEGDILLPDDCFTCVNENTPLTVRRDDHGLYFDCADGHHYLDGQADDGVHLIGLTRTA